MVYQEEKKLLHQNNIIYQMKIIEESNFNVNGISPKESQKTAKSRAVFHTVPAFPLSQMVSVSSSCTSDITDTSKATRSSMRCSVCLV